MRLTGQVFGELTVVSESGRAHGYVVWLCRCTCGNMTHVRADRLRGGHTRSCGHLVGRSERIGRLPVELKGTKRSWYCMNGRTTRRTAKTCRNYIDRGIEVCERWRQSFDAFVEDMGVRPGSEYTIDRIDNERGYEPGNCRWATKSEQRRNSRDTVWVEWCGERVRLADLVERFGMSGGVVRQRLGLGWSIDRALSEPVRVYKRRESDV